MTFVINAFDDTKREDGEWVTFEGAQLCIAYGRNTKFIKALNRLRKPYQRQIDKGTLDPDTAESIMCEAMAEGILVDWKEVYNYGEDGELVEVKYSKDIAKQALVVNPELREFVSEFSASIDNYRKENTEATAKKQSKR